MAHCRLNKRQKRTKTHPAKLLVMCHCLTLKTVSEMSTEININGLLEKPLWQMTGEEYCQLTQYAGTRLFRFHHLCPHEDTA